MALGRNVIKRGIPIWRWIRGMFTKGIEIFLPLCHNVM